MTSRPPLAALRAATRLADLLALCATYAVVLAIRWALGSHGIGRFSPIAIGPNLRLLVLLLPTWWGALEIVGSYRGLRRMGFLPLLSMVMRATALATVGVVIVLYALHLAGGTSRTLVFGFGFASMPALVVTRFAMIGAARRWLADHPAERLLLVGTPAGARPVLATLSDHPEWGIHPAGLVTDTPEGAPLPVVGALATFERVLDDVRPDHVLAVGGSWDLDRIRRLADACEALGVRFSVEANFLGLATSGVVLDDMDGWAMISFSSRPVHAEALVLKRLVDVVGATLGLVLLAPLLALIALAVRREDGGPVLFAQTRVGLHGRPFTLYKFRSMVVDAEVHRAGLERFNEVDGPAFKMRRDPRITRVGAVLRRFSLDELPQMYNVLRGDMSLVGPRPPLASEVACYERWQLRRLSMRPGLTGLWQVSGRGNPDFTTWIRLDLEYIDTWSLGLDLHLLLRTLPVVIRGIGAR